MKTRMIFGLLMAAVVGGANENLEEFESQTREITCTIKPIPRSRIHPKRAQVEASNEQVESTNWSGYAAAPSLEQPANGSVTYVAASWIVPALEPTPSAAYSAIWVGIDGFLNGTVEQMGTSHNWFGAQENYAWFEMYPNGSYEISGFPVDIGDQISVRIGYKGDNVFKMVMVNWTQNVSTVIPLSYTTMANTLRSTAEWVVEAPYAGEILPLADFKPITFNYCSAIINGVMGSISDSNWVNDSITMEDSPTILKAVPSALLKNGSCFQMTWKHE